MEQAQDVPMIHPGGLSQRPTSSNSPDYSQITISNQCKKVISLSAQGIEAPSLPDAQVQAKLSLDS